MYMYMKIGILSTWSFHVKCGIYRSETLKQIFMRLIFFLESINQCATSVNKYWHGYLLHFPSFLAVVFTEKLIIFSRLFCIQIIHFSHNLHSESRFCRALKYLSNNIYYVACENRTYRNEVVSFLVKPVLKRLLQCNTEIHVNPFLLSSEGTVHTKYQTNRPTSKDSAIKTLKKMYLHDSIYKTFILNPSSL